MNRTRKPQYIPQNIPQQPIRGGNTNDLNNIIRDIYGRGDSRDGYYPRKCEQRWVRNRWVTECY